MQWLHETVARKKPRSENCALPVYYAASIGNSLPTFRDNLSVPSSAVIFELLNPEEVTDWLSRKVGKELPILAA